MRRFTIRTTAPVVLLAGALVLGACAGDGDADDAAPAAADTSTDDATEDDIEVMDEPAEEADGHDMADMDPVALETTAEQLRATLNRLLQEHVTLAGFATGEYLAGSTGGFEAAATQLTEVNTAELADVIGSVYGEDVGAQFAGLWNSHIELFVEYTVAVDAGDVAGQDDAVERLIAYADELAVTFETLTEGALPADASTEGIVEHVTSLKAVVDAQAAGDAELAFTSLRSAARHMDHLATAIAGAVADQHGLEGDAGSDLAAIRSELTALLQEHVYLAGAFTGQALTGGDGVEAARTALLAGNTEDLADLVASVYGERIARDDFVQFWNSHILMFVGYTEGVADDDAEARDAAVADLRAYGADLARVFDALTLGDLPADASGPLLTEHVTTLLPAIDAQGAGDPAEAYRLLRTAARHMEMIASPLFDATVSSL